MSRRPPAEMLQLVLKRLHRVTGPDSEGWYTTLCPFHEDRQRPNLRVRSTGYRCMRCGAKGALPSLANRIGLEVNVDLSERIDTAYDYVDEQGERLFQVVRLRDPKDFKQRRPDGQGGWIWNLKSVRRVLYRLPELIAADLTEPAFIVEGEKDADNLSRLGLIATTNPGGAGKWRKEYSHYLAGRMVIILPDQDEAGRAHAAQVSEMTGGAVAELKVVHLPGLPEKGDVSDWIAAGGTKDELLAIVAEAEPIGESAGAPAVMGRAVSDGGNAADRLVNYALDCGGELFHDQRNEPYTTFQLQDRRQIWPLRSQAARQWLSHMAWRSEHKAPSSEIVRTALGVLESMARFEGGQHRLNVRVARHDGAIWYDLSDWRAVRVDARGWQIVDEPPILFRRFATQKAQVEPVMGGDLRDLLRLVNIKDPGPQLLLLVYLVVALVPDIPRPIIVARGEHGSGKSTLFTLLRDLLDPSLIRRGSAPDSPREFVQAASHALCLYLDNLSYLPDWMSDALCRLCTGDGFTKRQLYTDDDDVIYSIRGLGGVNGINLVATKPDLLDRSLIFTLEAIADADRLIEQWCEEEFERQRPRLLGAMFDALSRSMATVDQVTMVGLPRMADFARWGCAAAEALGYGQGEFLRAMGHNVREQNESALENSPVAQAVIQLLREDDTWEDTPSATLARLNRVAEKLQIDTKAKAWPKSPSALTRRLNEVRPNLLRAGIEVVTGGNVGDHRIISFRYAKNAVNAVNRHENAVKTAMNAVSLDDDGVNSDDSGRGLSDTNDVSPDDIDGTDGILATSSGRSTTRPLWEQNF